MDILNWLYLAKNKFVRTTLGSTKDLMIFGSKVGFNKRGDLYQNYAMSAEDFTTSVADVVKPYKVYTALLSQSGGDDPSSTNYDLQNPLIIGQSYLIDENLPLLNGGTDFTNVGAPNNNQGTYFVATGTTPIWGINSGYLVYNTGAPTVTVLENTIGNVWWTWQSTGSFLANSDDLFTQDKTLAFISQSIASEMNVPVIAYTYEFGLNRIQIETYDSTNNPSPGVLWRTPIEIRVYN